MTPPLFLLSKKSSICLTDKGFVASNKDEYIQKYVDICCDREKMLKTKSLNLHNLIKSNINSDKLEHKLHYLFSYMISFAYIGCVYMSKFEIHQINV